MSRTIAATFCIAHSLSERHTMNAVSRRFASSRAAAEQTTRDHDVTATETPAEQNQNNTKKTMAQLDEELRQKMSGIAGDGGDAGIEYEDGKPVAMKRSVKNNMFRYI
ncbi:hypothetical protein F5Y19DRAFT_180345 [Xylariaceae sp. FL1651]|nr:hypothetical protein F5Y19DRAFT_180345 [Xylariaceae sp. FL1651]